jgi:hypothetical protein
LLFSNVAVTPAAPRSLYARKDMPWIDKAEARMNEAGKRRLRVTEVQVEDASLYTKAKTIEESDQGISRILDSLRSERKKNSAHLPSNYL